MGKIRNQLHATPCEHCQATGKEPRSGQRVCSVCLGVQYINADIKEAFSEFDALRFLTLKLVPIKDMTIRQLREEVSRLQHMMIELKPYMEKKQQAELASKVYPPEHTKARANCGAGGYGD